MRRKSPRLTRFNGVVMARATATAGTGAGVRDMHGVQVMGGRRLPPLALPLLQLPTPLLDLAPITVQVPPIMGRARILTIRAKDLVHCHTMQTP